MFRRVLIANRGEIAVRIIRTLREMDITSVAMFSDADREALFVLEADEAYHLGPAPAPESYLNVNAILSLARETRVDAVHPGYGFLAENAPFAAAVRDAGITFIGPSPEAIRTMGDKVEARHVARANGVPVVPGTPGPVESLEEGLAFGRESGYPVAVKASGGGGGRGIRVVNGPDEMGGALDRARREAETYFKNSEVYLERYFPDPRHIEFQVLGDRLGHLVHLGERDCSVQRRHQKLIEETPSPAVSRELRSRMGEMALRVARAEKYDSAGTVEFLLSREGEFYFLEMNTRIQVEHPITEAVTGTDLIREMILAAAGEPITVCDSVLDPNGHAIEVRINAEDPLEGFRPTPTEITRYHEPGGIGVRMDSGVSAGYTIPQDYDSLMAKLIAWAPDRDGARRRTLRALGEYVIDGPASTIPFARAVLQHEEFVQGEVGTTFVADRLPALEAAMRGSSPVQSSGAPPNGWSRGEERVFEVMVNRRLFHVSAAELKSETVRERKRLPRHGATSSTAGDALTSPMHGTVLAIKKSVGDAVVAGEALFIIEAMKMENEIVAHRAGTVREIATSVGQTVESGQALAVIS